MINRLASMLLLRKRLIALTFDDGPDKRTPEILDLLDEHGALATFFVLGRQVEGREEVLRRAVESGHELGNHSFSHPRFEDLQPAEIEDELVRTTNAIEQAVSVRPRLMRPPYGLGIDHAAPVARRLGLKPVLWSLDPKDWTHTDPKEISEPILTEAQPGAVVVLHDGAAHGGDRSPTLEALRTAVPELGDRGYGFVTLSTLLKRSPWAARTAVPRGPFRRTVQWTRTWVRADSSAGDV